MKDFVRFTCHAANLNVVGHQLGMLEPSSAQDLSQTSSPVNNRGRVPRKGDRIQPRLPRAGIYKRGTVYYVDDLQILVKWDDGRSEGLRNEFADHFRILEGPGDEPNI